jgi:hypothetical protein
MMMRLFFGDAWSDDTLVIKSFYKVFQPDLEAMALRDKKVKKVIATMGERYLLAVTRGRLDGVYTGKES